MRYHPAGQDLKVWVEAVSDSSYLEYKSTVASLTARGSTNGGTSTALTGVTAVFDSDMDMFLVTIPSANLPANGNNFFARVDWAGIIDVKIEAYITKQLAATDDIFDTIIEDTFTFKQIIMLVAANAAGNDDRSGATKHLKSLDGTKNRISYTTTSTSRTVTGRDVS
jgi:hypothetical protein